jgi:hypothetical protein
MFGSTISHRTAKSASFLTRKQYFSSLLSDVRRDMEASHGYEEATQSAFFLLSPAQKTRLDRYMRSNFKFDKYDNNCADFAHGALLASTGINVDIADISSFLEEHAKSIKHED